MPVPCASSTTVWPMARLGSAGDLRLTRVSVEREPGQVTRYSRDLEQALDVPCALRHPNPIRVGLRVLNRPDQPLDTGRVDELQTVQIDHDPLQRFVLLDGGKPGPGGLDIGEIQLPAKEEDQLGTAPCAGNPKRAIRNAEDFSIHPVTSSRSDCGETKTAPVARCASKVT